MQPSQRLRLKGETETKATALLKKQHREVEGLFAKVLKSDVPKERKNLAAEISAKFRRAPLWREE